MDQGMRWLYGIYHAQLVSTRDWYVTSRPRKRLGALGSWLGLNHFWLGQWVSSYYCFPFLSFRCTCSRCLASAEGSSRPKIAAASRAPPATILHSRADRTVQKYLGAFGRWKRWAEAHQDVPSFPVQDIHLALYLQHLGESVESKSAVEEAVYALDWLHGVAGLGPLGSTPIVQATLAGLRRALA